MEGTRETDPTKPWKSSRDAGMITRSVNIIFETLSKSGDEYSVKVSHLEIYNGELCDLLNPDNKNLKFTKSPHQLLPSQFMD